jgi:predicted amidohydrolase YtcJ
MLRPRRKFEQDDFNLSAGIVMRRTDRTEGAMNRLAWKTIVIVVVFAIASSVSIAHAQQAAPDLILSNGKIITVDQRFTIAEALAVKNDRIVAVGSNQEIARLAGPNTRKIDLKGKSVIPGLIDNHMHLLRAAETWVNELRWDGVDSRKQAIDMLRARAKQVGPGQWVYNIGGWTHQQFSDDPRPFTREELDRIAPDNPVALQESYYQVFLNGRALQAFGIAANTPDPTEFVKGSVMRDASGNPTGVIKGDIAATRPVAAKMPKVPPDQLEASAAALVRDVNRAGLTSFGVAGCNADVRDIFQRWKQQGRLNVRSFCIGGAAAGSPEQVDRSIQQIATMKLFQGDTYIDDIFFGESV